VTSRTCLDYLRRRGTRGEEPIELTAGILAAETDARSRIDPGEEAPLADGLPGILIMAGGRPVTVMTFTVTGDVITEIHVLRDPGRLARIVPSWVTASVDRDAATQ
jgi:hypothetical protein